MPALPVHADATGNLFAAAKGGTASEVKAALAAGTDPNAIEINSGMTALHAAFANSPSVIKALIEGGADPNARGEKSPAGLWAAKIFPTGVERAMFKALTGGGTPLHVAARFNSNPSVIATLIEGGADPGARNDKGRVPFDYVKDSEALKGTEVYRLLSEGWFE